MPRKRSEVRAAGAGAEAAAPATPVADPWDLAGPPKSQAQANAPAPRRRRSEAVGAAAEAAPATPEPPPPAAVESQPPAPPPAATAAEADDLFVPAPGRRLPAVPELRRGLASIVRRVFDEGFDVDAEYAAIEESLTVKGALTPGALAEAANRGEEMARRSFRLYVVAQQEHEAFVRETDAIVGAMREDATASLEKDKATGARSKQITDADVVARIAQLFPAEWAHVCDRRGRAEKMVGYLKNLADLSRSRCFAIAHILGGKPRL